MTGSLRALLAGAIDYAGMFPPARLELEMAIEEIRRYRRDLASWIVGRFVVPAAQLPRLAAIYDSERDGRLSVVVPAAESEAAMLKTFGEALGLVNAFPVPAAADMLEIGLPPDLLSDADASRLGKVIQSVAAQIAVSRLGPIKLYFELPRRETRAPRGAHDTAPGLQIRAAIAALAEYNRTASARNFPAGFKLRCGGTEIGEIPSSAEVAKAVCACRDRGVFWKATAGLHHPFRHFDLHWQVPVHGFLNLHCAAVLAHVHRLDKRQTQAVIEEADRRQFTFSDEALAWRDCVATTEQIGAAREQTLQSFGSCSFDEPCDELRQLGLL
jgi:hypothetical protein